MTFQDDLPEYALGTALAERDKAIVERDTACAALAAVEWVDDGHGGQRCPWCKHYKEYGHASYCQRQSALGVE